MNPEPEMPVAGAAPDAFAIVDDEGRIIECNLQLEKMFGFEAGEMTGVSIESIVPEPLREKHARHRAAFYLVPRDRQMAFRTRRFPALRKDRTEFPAEITLIPAGDSSSGRVLAIVRDMTEADAAAAALRDAEQRYRLIFEGAADAIIIVASPYEPLITCNPSAVTMFGAPSREALISSTPQALTPKIQSCGTATPVKSERIRQELLSRDHVEYEWTFRRFDGSLFDTEVSMVQLSLSDRPVFLLNIRDITERKRQEGIRKVEFEVSRILSDAASLREAGPAIMRTLVTGLGWDFGDIFLYDPSSGRSELLCVFHDGQPAFTRLEKESPAVISAESDAAVQHLIESRTAFWLENVEGFTERSQLAFECGLQSAVVVPFVNMAGINGAFSLFSRQHKPEDSGLIPILCDIGAKLSQFAARTKAQEELEAERRSLKAKVEERAAELRQANEQLALTARLKDQFLASMSHELRTPIGAILGHADLLIQGLPGPLNERQIKALQTIEGSGRHLLALVDDILDISKIVAGRVKLEPYPVWVEPLCASASQFVQQAAQRKGLLAECSVKPKTLRMLADERRLRQILVNLLSNAVKFTQEGGRLGLDAWADQDGTEVHFCVWDSGIGISGEDIPRLFQPFTQLDSRLSRQHSGAGLGLALVKKLVDLHGGKVEMRSELGKGTRVTVSLPGLLPEGPLKAAPAVPERVRPLVSGIPEGKGRVILIAEDNETIIDTTAALLEARGYRTVVARNGEEAVRQAVHRHPDLILMDVQMPGVDGLEATRRIRRMKTLSGVRIIALTALVMPGDRDRCLEAGCDDYLSKPLDLGALAAVIRGLPPKP